MKQINLDDLPPRLVKAFTDLDAGEELLLVQQGVVVARLLGAPSALSTKPPVEEPPDEERMKEVMEQFNAMIHDEF